jgi:3'-phosphoadenosine 5'-phosphosulfate sulfotransferase (PAPS reductase)/FAD synthetase
MRLFIETLLITGNRRNDSRMRERERERERRRERERLVLCELMRNWLMQLYS